MLLGAGDLLAIEAHGNQHGADGVRIFDARLSQPFAHGLLGVGLLDAAHGLLVAAVEGVFEKALHALDLIGGFGFRAAAQTDLLEAQQVFAELRRGALGG